jgi:hypothetical protein
MTHQYLPSNPESWPFAILFLKAGLYPLEHSSVVGSLALPLEDVGELCLRRFEGWCLSELLGLSSGRHGAWVCVGEVVVVRFFVLRFEW